MYVEVELRGTPQANRIIIPRAAIHGGRVYVVSKENRLRINKVKIAYAQGNISVLTANAAANLKAGERIIVSDLIPAIEGMLLNPVDDKTVQQSLSKAANGEDRL